jgi:WD40 repeat protein
METRISSAENGIQTNGYLPGRQRQVVDLLSLFQSSQIVGLFGDNGSGKSTIAQVALVQELQNGFLGIAGKNWMTTTIRPGVTPLENLSAGLFKLLQKQQKQKLQEELELVEKMKSSTDGLKQVFRRYIYEKSDCNYLLIIDNLEDLFHFKSTAINKVGWELNTTSFIQNISKCASASDIPIYFLIILRSDFVSNIFEFRNFHELISKSQYSLPQFRKSEFQEVIFSLLKHENFSITKEAVDFLYLDIGKDLKNLTLLSLLLDRAKLVTKDDLQKQISHEVVKNISSSNIYEEVLESFFNSLEATEKKIVEKIFKQITSSQEGSNQRKPIRIDQLLKVIGIRFHELKPIISNLNDKLDFALEIIYPYQERLISEDDTFISDTAIINIKNEQFIQHWPRLVEWIKQEAESQEIYTRLSESAKMFDQKSTDYLRPPDLDYTLKWYEEKNPGELWANQFNGNYKKAINYLLESKEKYQEDILKKETLQKEKIKRIRKTGVYIILGALLIVIVIAVFYFRAVNSREEAKQAKDKAQSEEKNAKMEKARADSLYNKAQLALEEAQKSEKKAQKSETEAKQSAIDALAEKTQADSLKIKAIKQKGEIEKTYNELEKTNANLKRSDSLKSVATSDAESGRDYQKAINTILSLRNRIDKNDFQKDSLVILKKEVKAAYEKYNSVSLAFKGLILPNNDLFQVLIKVRTEPTDQTTYNAIPQDLASLSSGLRRLSVSPSGIVATGGDDGILLYSELPITQLPVKFIQEKIKNDRNDINDRIRSLIFISSNELIIGTVSGRLYKFNTLEKQLQSIKIDSNPKSINIKPNENQIIEELLVTNNGLFILRGQEILRLNLKDQNKVDVVKGILPNKVFKFNEEKLIIQNTDNTLLFLDTSTLEYVPINTDLGNKTISVAIASKDLLFLGMENGDVYVCRSIKSGKSIRLKTEYIISAHFTRITSLAYDTNTQKLFTASLDQKANIFDLNLYKVGQDYITNNLIKIEGFDKWIWDFELIKLGTDNTILTVDENGNLKTWQTSSKMLYDEIFENK